MKFLHTQGLINTQGIVEIGSAGDSFAWHFGDGSPTQWLADLPLQKGKNLCQHGRRPLPPLHLHQRRLCLGQAERHVHGFVQLNGDR
jgi:hypothetical protein